VSASVGDIGWTMVWEMPAKPSVEQVSELLFQLKQAFDDFVAPELDELSSWLDHSLYHLDGPGALRHLERLLAIPELDCVQWMVITR